MASILQIKGTCMVRIHWIDDDCLNRELVWVILILVIFVLHESKYKCSSLGFEINTFIKSVWCLLLILL